MPARVAEIRSERLIEALLSAQGWDLRRPPNGNVLAQHEYKDYPSLRGALAKCSKTGDCEGIPEYILVDRLSVEPLAVFEAKAHIKDLNKANAEVQLYGNAFFDAGYKPLAVAVAGTEDDRFEVRVLKRRTAGWEPITYDGNPITWIPNAEQVQRMRLTRATDLRPAVPPIEILASRAKEINGLLRDAGLKDDYRPPAIGAIMLALWKTKGDIRRTPEFILADVNQACASAFWKAGKADLSQSLRVEEANVELAVAAKRICEILEVLNITNLTAEHDYLGALYEEFFRYTGGNTIGQYFTPRHIAHLMVDLCQVDKDDTVIDIACGTGGFLIAAMHRMQQQAKLPHEQIVEIISKKLIGFDKEPVTAALCVANMVLRGDGTTGISRTNAFDEAGFPVGRAQVGLMNPPFPHEATDKGTEDFVNRLMQALCRRGLASVIVPSSLLVKRDKAIWRNGMLQAHTLLAVITLPDELFLPFSSTTTTILLLQKGIPHNRSQDTYFCRIENDGLRLKKGVRVPIEGSQIQSVSETYRRNASIAGFCKTTQLEDSWAPGLYIDAKPLANEEFREGVAELIRNKVAFTAKFAPYLSSLLSCVQEGELIPRQYGRVKNKIETRNTTSNSIGNLFDIYYGQKALHCKEGLLPGNGLIISSKGIDNGCFGFFDFNDLLKPPFVTVPSTGSIGEAAVQEFPCGVTDDCLILIPKENNALEVLYVAAATLRHEKWRFNYGRKMTPTRIANFPLRLDAELLNWVNNELKKAKAISDTVISAFSLGDHNK